MPESIHQSQKATRPKIEDVAGNFLSAENNATLQDFVKFLRAGKIGVGWASGNSWSLRYKGKLFGSLHIHNGMWRFAHRGIEKYYQMDDGDLKTFIFDNIYARNCGNCQWDPGSPKAGYMQPTGCGCWPLRIFNAGGEVLENTKKLVEFRMKCILEDIK